MLPPAKHKDVGDKWRMRARSAEDDPANAAVVQPPAKRQREAAFGAVVARRYPPLFTPDVPFEAWYEEFLNGVPLPRLDLPHPHTETSLAENARLEQHAHVQLLLAVIMHPRAQDTVKSVASHVDAGGTLRVLKQLELLRERFGRAATVVA